MMWPFSKKKDKDKDVEQWAIWQEETPQQSRFAYFFELPWYIKIWVLLAIIFGFNVVLFLPLGITAELFEIWLVFIQALKMQIPLWMVAVIGAILIAIGVYLIPRIDIPSLEEKHIYLSHWKDGNLHYFHTLKGTLAFRDEWVKNIAWFRWVAIGNVEVETTDERSRLTAYESKDLEVSKDIALEQENIHLKRTIAKMERDQRNMDVHKMFDMLGTFVERTKERK